MPTYSIITDRISENPDRSFNGGDYSFWRIVRQDGDSVSVTHRTSAEFDYCPRCGHFENHDPQKCGAEFPSTCLLENFEKFDGDTERLEELFGRGEFAPVYAAV